MNQPEANIGSHLTNPSPIGNQILSEGIRVIDIEASNTVPFQERCSPNGTERLSASLMELDGCHDV